MPFPGDTGSCWVPGCWTATAWEPTSWAGALLRAVRGAITTITAIARIDIIS